jgi:hypothetical protein
MGLAWRFPSGSCDGKFTLNRNFNTETHDPVVSPPLPVPDRIVRGQLSPRAGRNFLRMRLRCDSHRRSAVAAGRRSERYGAEVNGNNARSRASRR